jgi:O-succinylbenzoic acid--CoA ligase
MERAQLAALAAATGVAQTHGEFTFLCDPHWTAAQRKAFADLKSKIGNSKSKISRGWLCIATGGSSGGLRFARHDEHTLGAAVRGFCAQFSLPAINAIDVLPPWHVSGFMARVRCGATGGRHEALDWKRLERGGFPETAGCGPWLLSLVPTQLQRMLARPAARDWLRGLHLIFVGGGPVWPGLADAAQAAGLPLSLSYGMTETAAMIAAQRPGDFGRGDRSSGVVMPHARITIGADNALRVGGASVMRGYLGGAETGGEFATADLGRIDEQGRLFIAGRRDDVVITGGENVNLREVETILRGLRCFDDVAVLAVPDAEWGEAVVACYTAAEAVVPPDQVINSHLLRQQRPKRWLRLPAAEWPRNTQGKLNRAALRAAVSALIDPGR